MRWEDLHRVKASVATAAFAPHPSRKPLSGHTQRTDPVHTHRHTDPVQSHQTPGHREESGHFGVQRKGSRCLGLFRVVADTFRILPADGRTEDCRLRGLRGTKLDVCFLPQEGKFVYAVKVK